MTASEASHHAVVRSALDDLLPAGAVGHVVPIDALDALDALDAPLTAYVLQVASFAPRRLASFLAGRVAAHRCCDALGVHLATGTIGIGEHRVPQFPVGVTGSISHDDRWAVAVALRTGAGAALTAIGVDIEPALPLPDDVADVVRRPADVLAGSWPDRAVLCVKESAFKCWFPTARRWLEHDDIVVTIDEHGSTTARVVTGDLPAVSGRIIRAADRLVALGTTG